MHRPAFVFALALLAAPAANGAVVSFRSPSSNIGCVGTTSDVVEVRCDIRQRTWRPPPRPPGCELDFGQGIALGAKGRPAFVCAGDTALNRDRVLAYGRQVRIASITCTSRRTGMTCTNRAGHGFLLSTQRYRLF